MLANFVDWIKWISNRDWYHVIEFIFFLAGIIGFLWLALKKSKELPVKGYLLILAILLIGLILPAIRLVIWDWSTTIDIILNILAIICLLNFLGLLSLMKVMDVFATQPRKEEHAIHIRGTQGFFNDAIKVHLEWEEFGGYPPNHKMNGKIWTPG